MAIENSNGAVVNETTTKRRKEITMPAMTKGWTGEQRKPVTPTLSPYAGQRGEDPLASKIVRQEGQT